MELPLKRYLRARARQLATVAVAVSLISPAAAVEVEFLGEERLPTGTLFEDTEVGGLSGIAYDAENQRYVAISDDRSVIAPARFYTLTIDLADGRLGAGDVRFVDVTILRDLDGKPFARGQLDPEGIALAGDGSLYISSEGDTKRGVLPFVRRFAADGRHMEALELPAHYLPDAEEHYGVRSNLGFEGLDVAPGWATLFTACENALLQDGPVADIDVSSEARILEFDLISRRPVREYVYEVGPVPKRPQPTGAFRTNGVSEILAIDGRLLVIVERSFSAGRGNTVRLFEVRLDTATNVLDWQSLKNSAGAELHIADKRLLFDLADYGIEADNIEGITLGPTLPDGRHTLVLVSDNNFKPDVQSNQFLAFAVDGLEAEPRPPVTISQIQGRGHRSTFEDQWVDGVRGVVTALREGRSGARTLWLQDGGDNDAASSDAIKIVSGRNAPPTAVGDLVAVSGRVEEFGFRDELSVTRITASVIEVLERGVSLPPVVRLGDGGRPLPRGVIDDDGLGAYDPTHDAIDFFESLESMRVAVHDALVVGPNSQHGEIAVLADHGAGSGPRSSRGALLASAEDLNPERVLVDDRLVDDPPDVRVGDRFGAPLEGVLDYAYGAYRMYNTSPLPLVESGGLQAEATAVGEGDDGLRVATFNLENLSFLSRQENFERLAAAVVDGLASPHIIAVQEVQDDSGRSDDGIVSAERTLGRLASAIEAAGGPAYQWRQCDPADGADGGVPGANIRVAFLIDPRRVHIVDRGACDDVGVRPDGSPTSSPGRLAAHDPAFEHLPEIGHFGTRKPLVIEVEFNGKGVVLVNNHLNSKIGDDQPFGSRQPPEQGTRPQRLEQARVVGAFVASILERDPGARVIVLGDFNDFEDSPPVLELVRIGLENQIERLPVEERYTYIFQGNAQTIDHLLVSPALVAGATVDIVHLDSEFPVSERASDHDPVLVRFAPW